MSDSASQAMSTTDIQSAVGSIEIPDSASDMAAALAVRWPSVMRMHRRAIEHDPDCSWLPGGHTPVPWYSLGFVANDESVRLSRFLQYARGDYYLQDSGSMLALAAAQADSNQLSGLTVCDLCAAPGGKASALLEAVGEDGFVLANETIRSRLAPLKYNLARTGSDRYAISSLDVDALAERIAGQFDLVLVDAPCSGQALLSRKQQEESAFSNKQIRHSALRQHRILDAAVRLLRPGGQLVYSTCTFAKQENEDQVHRLASLHQMAPRALSALDAYESAEGCYRLWPHRHRCAGAFASSMRKTDTDEADKTRPLSAMGRRKSKRIKSKHKPTLDRNLTEQAEQWFAADNQNIRWEVDGRVVFGFAKDVPEWVERVAVAGPELAYRTGRTWKPSHEAALRQGSAKLARQSIELCSQQAALFMTGHTVETGNGVRGWAVVSYQECPLGWLKADGTTGKNHLIGSARMTSLPSS